MIETDRLVAPDGKQNEDALDRAIRPRALADYVGQPVVREQMEIFVAAARGRREALDHTLIFGPPGLGKTTLAHIIANEMGVSLKSTSGPVLEKAGDLAALLTNLERGDVLFIDEIHRLSPHVEEVLYPAMEDFQLDIMIGEGPAARSPSARSTAPTWKSAKKWATTTSLSSATPWSKWKHCAAKATTPSAIWKPIATCAKW